MPNTAPQDPDFQARSQACLDDLLEVLDSFDPDELEADLSGGVLKIQFADGRTCVVNRQAAASQIWLAEGAEAWHFQFDPAQAQWLDTKGRGELRAILTAVVSARLGRSVDL
jgi:CyaY protein